MRIKDRFWAFLVGAALACVPALGWNQPSAWGQEHSVKQDLKTTGHETKVTAKDTGHDIHHGTKKAYHKTKHGTKKAWHKTKNTTKGAVHGAQEGADRPAR